MLLQKTIRLTKNQKGLTLIELLAIIVILGIIAAIAVPAIAGIINKSKTDADEQTASLIESAAYLYLVQHDPNDTTPGQTSISVSDLTGYLEDTAVVSQVSGLPFTTIEYSWTATDGYTDVSVDIP